MADLSVPTESKRHRIAIAQVRVPFQAQFLNAVPSTSCGSEPCARPADCAAHYPFHLSPSLANREATLCVKRFGYYVMRRPLGFYPITQSASVPIVWVDALGVLHSTHDRLSQTRRSPLGSTC